MADQGIPERDFRSCAGAGADPAGDQGDRAGDWQIFWRIEFMCVDEDILPTLDRLNQSPEVTSPLSPNAYVFVRAFIRFEYAMKKAGYVVKPSDRERPKKVINGEAIV